MLQEEKVTRTSAIEEGQSEEQRYFTNSSTT